MEEDIRWKQRFSNYKKALSQLQKAVEMTSFSDIEKEGLVQRFEYTFELAWNVMKDFLEEKGNSGILGSKDAIKLAFKLGLIDDGEKWMDMVNSRRLSAHTYDEATANAIVQDVINEYYPLFAAFKTRMEKEDNPSTI
jgi:nucleotidyltransferase substrate binding protein (TIGR01987 family)